MSVVLAEVTAYVLVPAIIGAAGSVVSALLLVWVALRAQSAQQQVEEVRKVIDSELKELLNANTRGLIIGEWVKKALREVLGSDPRSRRWYDPSDPRSERRYDNPDARRHDDPSLPDC